MNFLHSFIYSTMQYKVIVPSIALYCILGKSRRMRYILCSQRLHSFLGWGWGNKTERKNGLKYGIEYEMK